MGDFSRRRVEAKAVIALLVTLVVQTQLGAAHASDWVLSADAVGTRYSSTDAGAVQIDGVCSFDGTGMTCWKPDGKLDRALTTHVSREYESTIKNYQRDPDLPARTLIVVGQRRAPKNPVLAGMSATTEN